MTVTTTQSRVTYAGDSVTLSFPIPFMFLLNTDISAVVTDSSGNVTSEVYGSNFTLTGAGVPSGGWYNRTFVVPIGSSLSIFQNPPLEQFSVYTSNSTFPATTVMADLDRQTLMSQRLADILSRCVRGSDGDLSISGFQLPPAAQRANTVYGFDASGNPSLAVLLASALTQSQFNAFFSGFQQGAAPYKQTLAEITAGVIPANLNFPQGDVRRYGAAGDGATNDFAAVNTAFTVIIAAGNGSVTFAPGATYYLGTITTDGKAAPLMPITGLSNCTIYGNGATILTNTTAFVVGAVFAFVNAKNIVIYDLNFTDTGFDQSQSGSPNFKCAHSVLLSSTTNQSYSGFTMVNCQASNTGSLLGTWQSAPIGRLTNINLFGCRALNCFYGANFQQQGDDVTIQGFFVLNPIRAYFPYGVSGHSVDIVVRNDGTNINAGSNALCDIKRYDLDTKEIKLRLTYHGDSTPYGALVNLEANVTSNAPATFDGIDIDLRLADSTVSGSSVGFPVQFRDVSTGSVVNPTATVWKRISLRGDVGQWPASNINNPINIASVPNVVRGHLAFEPDFFNILPPTPQVFPGFGIIPKPNTIVTTMQGDLTASNTGACDARTIGLTNYSGTLFCIRVTIYAEADYTVSSTQQCYRRLLILGRNLSNTVTIHSTNVEATYDNGTPSVVTAAASGNYIQLSFTNYSGSRATLRVETEHLSKFI